MVDVVALVLRMLHIVFGVAWIGAASYSVGVLRVAMPRVRMDARKEVMRHLIPTTIRYVPMSAVMTIVFGALLYLRMGRLDPDVLAGTVWGWMLLGALVLTLATFAYGMIRVIGSAKAIQRHLEEEVCDHADEVGALQSRFNAGQVVVLVLGIIILGMMVFVTGALTHG